jgi:hypothetical protein
MILKEGMEVKVKSEKILRRLINNRLRYKNIPTTLFSLETQESTILLFQNRILPIPHDINFCRGCGQYEFWPHDINFCRGCGQYEFLYGSSVLMGWMVKRV